MQQFLASFLPLLAVIAAAFILAAGVKNSGTRMVQKMDELGFGIANSPAQVAFFMFSITAAMASSAFACSFARVSSQLVLSLEILFLLSSLLLILLYQIKVSAPVSL